MNNPTHREVTSIFGNCYKLFDKFKDSKTEEDYKKMFKNANMIYEKYPYRMTENMLFEVVELIGCYGEGQNHE